MKIDTVLWRILVVFPPIFVTCRDDGDGEFMNILGNQLSEKGVLTFVTVAGKRGPWMFLLAGKVETVKELGPK